MRHTFRISEIADKSPSVLGGKAHSLARMIRAGLRVPDVLCIPIQAYQHYLACTGLLDRILITLFRKRFEDMRWEEIVERRGGMLFHGAIIAREYGIPCVTGVPDATSIVRTGDKVSVDGYF